MQFENNVADFLLDGKRGDRVAVEELTRHYTYGELRASATKAASYLLSTGGRKGDRVLIVSDNSFFWVSAYLGTLQAGLVAVPLAKNISVPELEYIRKDADCSYAFVQSRMVIGNCLANLHVISDVPIEPIERTASQIDFKGIALQEPARPTLNNRTDADDVAALMFTSGSTGRPRGVMVSHGNIIANTDSIIQYLALTESDRMMTVLPFHYCFGASLLHTHLRVGGSLVLENRFLYPETVLKRMIESKCTGFAGVPSTFQILLRKSSFKQSHFPALRHIQQAGGHLAPEFIRELKSNLSTTEIFVMYGQTEATARLSFVPPERLEEKLGSIGQSIPGVTLQVLNDAGVPVRPGEVGEIIAQGKNVAKGYWRQPAESAATFRDGQLHTGDLATVDTDGFIYVRDRAKNFLKCGGKRVGSVEIEDRLLEFEDIAEAAVIGISDGVLGEAVKAFVVPRSNNVASLKERLHLFCKQRMPSNLIPKEIVVLDTLPKNNAGKVLKAQLKAI